jgi:hypothetical protein
MSWQLHDHHHQSLASNGLLSALWETRRIKVLDYSLSTLIFILFWGIIHEGNDYISTQRQE